MTWTLHSDGVNDYVSTGSTISVSSNSTTTIKFGNGNDGAYSDANNRVFGLNNGNRTGYGKVGTTNRFRVRAFNVNTDFDWVDAAHSFVDAHEYKWVQDGTDTLFYVDNVLKVTALSDTRQLRITSIMGNVGGAYTSYDLWYLTIADNTTSSNDRQFNADSSGGTGSILPNDIGTDGTLVGFPGDDSQWVNVGGGGVITVTASTVNYIYSDISGSIDLTGAIDVTGQTSNYQYSAIDGTVNLTGEVVVSGQTTNYLYAALGGQVEFTGAISVIGATASYDYQSISGLVDLTGEITVLGQTAGYSYDPVNGSVELGALINVIGSSPNYNYQNINGVVNLVGEILVSGETAGYSYSAISGFVTIGGGQAIGTITAGFADDLYTADYKPDEITVTFKT